MLHCRLLAYLELAQAHLDESDLDGARRCYDEAKAIVETESFGTNGRGWLGRVGTLVMLASGDTDAAERSCAEIDDPFWAGISAARVHLARGDGGDALAALEALAPRCVRHEVTIALLRSRAVTDADEALKLVAGAVEQAAAYGMLRTLASEGPEVLELIEKAAWRAPPDWMDRLRRIAVRHRGEPLGSRDVVVELTDRERDVLRFLPSRLTLREIASELYVSVNTLKFHLKVIYRKLGVNSRADAADVARRMGSPRRSI